MDTRPVYLIEHTDPQEEELSPCCERCEFCDIALVPLERRHYAEEGSRWWRNQDGVPVRKVKDKQKLICSLSGTGTVPDQLCPMFRKASVLWK